jgi:hypothetical protein
MIGCPGHVEHNRALWPPGVVDKHDVLLKHRWRFESAGGLHFLGDDDEREEEG